METLIKTIAHAWDLSSAHYWHLRILISLTLAPLVGVLCVVLFDKHKFIRAYKFVKPHKLQLKR